MSTVDREIHIDNLNWVLSQIRAGSNAKKYGHAMSVNDAETYTAARAIAEKLLAKEFENAGDDELITGMEQYIATVMETINAQSNSVQQ